MSSNTGIQTAKAVLCSIMSLINIVREHWANILVPLGFVLGCYLDRRNDSKLTAFRNKSLLYKRELKPGEETTWK
ncbi:NADH dehydrogenase [ubiquinone] 1 beta subcomplex subunit 1-like isoform X1 [Hemiscyllium ocellatum]|uniref:NADH dehydrogenase [ubiquinone] 1 beta subcomplex subunit 1-like isoform X1 n=2 Tax=Hemiscyllium ocellatum TaxID=170820 RepID=UPI00296647FC|nr:NADH dehydrogenase [ubiquinone] 1 beta subcomplex subunit 1-like isoform X1 [Hemiscyllium ocellatum]